MDLNYNLKSILGVVYKKGNVLFSPNGHLFSPVGNHISCRNIKQDTSHILPLQSSYDIEHIALSPNSSVLLAINEKGEGYLCSMFTKTVIAEHHFRYPISCASFSPDGRLFAVARDRLVLVYYVPSLERQVNQFYLRRSFYGATSEIVHIDWTSDGRVFAAASRDRTCRIYASGKCAQLTVFSLSHHRRALIGAHFLVDSLSIITVCEGGEVCVWRSDTGLDEVHLEEVQGEGTAPVVLDHNEKEAPEELDANETTTDHNGNDADCEESKDVKKVHFKLWKIYHYTNMDTQKRLECDVTRSAFHKDHSLLAAGLAMGSFMLHYMPDFIPVHQLCVAPDPVSTLCFSTDGDWLAVGCAERGQLAVWEWRSELFRYKGQSHSLGGSVDNATTTSSAGGGATSSGGFVSVTCTAYSGDGLTVATGGEDERVRVWRVRAGVCVHTFAAHEGAVTGVAFPHCNPRVLVSASLDGTVRVMDLHRYTTFRTLTATEVSASTPPLRSQFACVSVDARGDLVAAGTLDTFVAHVWSVQTGQLLVTLCGHEAPVRHVQFAPIASSLVSGAGPQLATGSWDRTVRLWDFLNSRDAKEVISVAQEVVAMTYRHDGLQLAVSTLNGELAFYNPLNCQVEHIIDTENDLGFSKLENEEVSAKQASSNKSFEAICYTSSGLHVIAGGVSKYICIYHVAGEVMVRRLQMTTNLSLAGVLEMHGLHQQHWHMIERVGDHVVAPLAAGKKLFPSERERRRFEGPEVRVYDLKFSPCGDGFAACTTEGLMVFSNSSLEQELVDLTTNKTASSLAVASTATALSGGTLLDASVTPGAILKALQEKDHATAFHLALRLYSATPGRGAELLRKVMEEGLPLREAPFHVRQLGEHPYLIGPLLKFLVHELNSSTQLQFYLTWADQLLCQHPRLLKQRSYRAGGGSKASTAVVRPDSDWAAQLVALQNPLLEKEKLLQNSIDWLQRTTDFLSQVEDAPMEAMDMLDN